MTEPFFDRIILVPHDGPEVVIKGAAVIEVQFERPITTARKHGLTDFITSVGPEEVTIRFQVWGAAWARAKARGTQKNQLSQETQKNLPGTPKQLPEHHE